MEADSKKVRNQELPYTVHLCRTQSLGVILASRFISALLMGRLKEGDAATYVQKAHNIQTISHGREPRREHRKSY